eukprot:4631860-Pleurochrysis_carterae.AAC.3
MDKCGAPPRLSMLPWAQMRISVSSLAAAALALESASMLTTSVAAPVVVMASSCPPPNADTTLPLSFRHRARSVRAFTSPRLRDRAQGAAYTCNEHGRRGRTGRVFFSH